VFSEDRSYRKISELGPGVLLQKKEAQEIGGGEDANETVTRSGNQGNGVFNRPWQGREGDCQPKRWDKGIGRGPKWKRPGRKV